MDCRLPPETPTRALLKRLHRRSSVLTSPLSRNFPDHSLSVLGGGKDCIQPNADDATCYDTGEDDTLEVDDHQGGHDDSSGDQSTLEIRNGRAHTLVDPTLVQVQELKWQVAELRKHKQEAEAAIKRGKMAAKQGVTWEAARKLEREFEAQEMILKGLQKDNERRTIESERLYSKLRTMSDFLLRHHGRNWQELVFGCSKIGGLSSSDLATGLDISSDRLNLKHTRPQDEGKIPKSSPFVLHTTMSSYSKNLIQTSDNEVPNANNPPPCSKAGEIVSPDTGDAHQDASVTEIDAGRWVDADTSFNHSTFADASSGSEASTVLVADESTNAVELSNARSAAPACPAATDEVQADPSDESYVGAVGQTNPSCDGKHEDKSVQNLHHVFEASAQPEAARSDPLELDRSSIREHLKDVLWLVEGFSRRCARRETELMEMEERARANLERGRETLLEDIGALRNCDRRPKIGGSAAL